MPSKIISLETALINRRSLLTGIAGLGAAGVMAGAFPRPAIAQEATWTFANSLRSLANPYHATFAKGGEEFAKSIGAKYETLVTEGNSEKGISDIKALLQRTGGKLIVNVDPNDSPDARVIVEEVKKESSKWAKQHVHPAFYWQSGYGAFSVGPSDLEALRGYIDGQEQHHRTRTFQDEFRAFLAKYGMEFDERYVWD